MRDNAGPLLIRAGLITKAQLQAAYQALGRGGGTLAECLVTAGVVDEEMLCTFFRERLLVPRIGMGELQGIPPQVISRMTADMAAEFRVVPVAVDRDKNLIVAMADPSDTHAVDEIAFFTGVSVFRVVAPVSAIAWALSRYYGVEVPGAPRPAPSGSPANGISVMPGGVPAMEPPRRKRVAQIVDDVFNEDTPIPQPVPMADTGAVAKLLPQRLSPDRPLPAATPTPRPASVPPSLLQPGAVPILSSAEADGALREALAALEAAANRDAVAETLVAYLSKLCRRAAFFVVRKGQLAGWLATGLGVYPDTVRAAAMPLDRPSTFRDIVRTRLPFRGPITDPASRDLLIDALGWAPTDMLAVPIAVRDKVVGILYGDDRLHPLPDEHLTAVSRAAETALQRAVAARKGS